MVLQIARWCCSLWQSMVKIKITWITTVLMCFLNSILCYMQLSYQLSWGSNFYLHFTDAKSEGQNFKLSQQGSGGWVHSLPFMMFIMYFSSSFRNLWWFFLAFLGFLVTVGQSTKSCIFLPLHLKLFLWINFQMNFILMFLFVSLTCKTCILGGRNIPTHAFFFWKPRCFICPGIFLLLLCFSVQSSTSHGKRTFSTQSS